MLALIYQKNKKKLIVCWNPGKWVLSGSPPMSGPVELCRGEKKKFPSDQRFDKVSDFPCFT